LILATAVETRGGTFATRAIVHSKAAIKMPDNMPLDKACLIACGVVTGVGAAMNPPTFLKAGDIVRVAIDKLGELRNPVVAEPADTAQF